MTKGWLLIAFALICSVATLAQDPNASPLPTPDADNEVVKISTNLIQLDVTVTDKKGKPIVGLRPDEIEIYENGAKQEITNFSFITALAPARQTVVATGVPPPHVPLRPDQIRRTIAIAVDDLSLSFESAHRTRLALKKFVDEQMQVGDLVAIIRTGAGIGALQQFTSDKRLLYAAIERVKWNPAGSGRIGAFAADDTSLSEEPGEEDEEDTAEVGGQSLDDLRSNIFATGTLGALRYIVAGMSELPGRKSVILFSDGFRLFNPDDSQSDLVLDFMRRLLDTANRSSVVFYTIDARGLVDISLSAADQIADSSADAVSRALSGRRDELFDTQEGLNFLASETGGIAIKNNNDLSGGVRRILEDQSYYLVAYEPDPGTFDPAKRRFNKLEVKVLRPGAQVRYRSGFFNVADKGPVQAPSTLSPAAQLVNALVSPFSVGGISMRLNALFGKNAANGTFVHSLLHINAGDLTFTDEKDGTKKAVLDVLAMSFGDNGQPIDQVAKTYSLILKPEGYKRAMADGFVYHFIFPVKKHGAYQYRVAVRDGQGNGIGSASQFIEVPNLRQGRLTLSSIVLETLSEAEWRLKADPSSRTVVTDPKTDTALRRIKKGSVLRYGFEVYNAKLDAARQPALKTKVRVFRDGELILNGSEKPIDLLGQRDMQHVKTTGALAIGQKMVAGDYILQIIVTDDRAKPKHGTATQLIQFEVVQ